MKAIGMARKVDQLGRIVLPAELRRLFGSHEGYLVEIYVEDNHIVLAKVEEHCVFCGATTELREFNGKLVCDTCVEGLKSS